VPVFDAAFRTFFDWSRSAPGHLVAEQSPIAARIERQRLSMGAYAERRHPE
jgi:hypothetical protein